VNLKERTKTTKSNNLRERWASWQPGDKNNEKTIFLIVVAVVIAVVIVAAAVSVPPRSLKF